MDEPQRSWKFIFHERKDHPDILHECFLFETQTLCIFWKYDSLLNTDVGIINKETKYEKADSCSAKEETLRMEHEQWVNFFKNISKSLYLKWNRVDVLNKLLSFLKIWFKYPILQVIRLQRFILILGQMDFIYAFEINFVVRLSFQLLIDIGRD